MAFVHKCALIACADPGVFVKGAQARFFFFFFRSQIILQFMLISRLNLAH